MRRTTLRILVLAVLTSLTTFACGDDDNGSPADKAGVGSECAKNDECPTYDLDGDGGEPAKQMECLSTFKGGYCGVQGCKAHSDCPEGSKCVIHSDGLNYCFLSCAEKVECNTNRDVANESNCSASVVFVDGAKGGKSCVPPSGN